MTRRQWCREHIDEVAEKCDLSRTVVSDVKQAAEFCDQHVEFSTCSTHTIMALIRVKDEQVRERAISLAQNALNASTPTGGKWKKSLTEPEIRKIISQAETELGKTVAPKPEEKTPPRNTPPKQKPMRCMYLSKDETRCHAGTEYQEKCTEEIRKNRNCPVPVHVPEPRRLSDAMTPDPDEEEEKPSESQVNNRRAIMPQATDADLKRFEVTARRYAQAAIRQFVTNKIADTEEQAAQRAFDLGIEKLLDEVEKKCMAEPSEEDEHD